MQIKVYGDDKVIHPKMHSENSGCLLHLFTNLTDMFIFSRLKILDYLKLEDDLRLEDNTYAIGYFKWRIRFNL